MPRLRPPDALTRGGTRLAARPVPEAAATSPSSPIHPRRGMKAPRRRRLGAGAFMNAGAAHPRRSHIGRELCTPPGPPFSGLGTGGVCNSIAQHRRSRFHYPLTEHCPFHITKISEGIMCHQVRQNEPRAKRVGEILPHLMARGEERPPATNVAAP